MRLRNYSTLAGMVAIIVAFVMVGTFADPAMGQGKPLEKINIYSMRVGTSGYVLSVALAEIINRNSRWLEATALETPGGGANVKKLQMKPELRKNTLIYAAHYSIAAAKSAFKPLFAKPYTSLRGVARMGNASTTWASIDPSIRGAKDLAGKRIVLGPKPTAFYYAVKPVFEEWGIWDRVKVETMAPSPAVKALKDGLVDLAYVAAFPISNTKWAGNPAFQDLLLTKNPIFLFPPKETFIKAREKSGLPILTMTIPGGGLGKKQPKPVIGLGFYLGWWADVEMPSKIVQEVCKIIYEHSDEFARYHVTGRDLRKELLGTLAVPEDSMHPGAREFYRAKGVRMGEMLE